MSHASLDVVAIGNAIVDIIGNADEAFLTDQGMAKGAMTLIDERKAETIYAAMGPAIELSGGSELLGHLQALERFLERFAVLHRLRELLELLLAEVQRLHRILGCFLRELIELGRVELGHGTAQGLVHIGRFHDIFHRLGELAELVRELFLLGPLLR